MSAIVKLSEAEADKLAYHEAGIERSWRTFLIEAGNHLAAIRAERLYRAEFSTFEAYCRERWGFSRSRAYQLMDASEVAEDLSTIVDTPIPESQARPLKALPRSERAEAFQEAQAKAGGKPTAKDVQEAVNHRLGRPAVKTLVEPTAEPQPQGETSRPDDPDAGTMAADGMLVGSLQTVLSRTEMNARTIPNLMSQIIQGERWQAFTFADGNVHRWEPHEFRAFIEAKRPAGLESSIPLVERMIRDTDAWEPFQKAIGKGDQNKPDREKRDRPLSWRWVAHSLSAACQSILDAGGIEAVARDQKTESQILADRLESHLGHIQGWIDALRKTAEPEPPKARSKGGSIAANTEAVKALQRSLSRLGSALDLLPDLIIEMRDGQRWRNFQFHNIPAPIRWEAHQFPDFIEADPPHGCGASLDTLNSAFAGLYGRLKHEARMAWLDLEKRDGPPVQPSELSPGQLGNNGMTVGALRSALADLDEFAPALLELIIAMRDGQGWRHFQTHDMPAPSDWGAGSFLEFLAAKWPHGCQADPEIVRGIILGWNSTLGRKARKAWSDLTGENLP